MRLRGKTPRLPVCVLGCMCIKFGAALFLPPFAGGSLDPSAVAAAPQRRKRISKEDYQQIVECETRLAGTQRQIAATQQKVGLTNSKRRKAELTQQSMDELPADTTFFSHVGRCVCVCVCVCVCPSVSFCQSVSVAVSVILALSFCHSAFCHSASACVSLCRRRALWRGCAGVSTDWFSLLVSIFVKKPKDVLTSELTDVVTKSDSVLEVRVASLLSRSCCRVVVASPAGFLCACGAWQVAAKTLDYVSGWLCVLCFYGVRTGYSRCFRRCVSGAQLKKKAVEDEKALKEVVETASARAT